MHDHLLQVLEEGLRAADPRLAVKRFVSREGDEVRVGDERAVVRGLIHAVGFGKASREMARGLLEALGDIAGGVVISPEGDGSIGPIKVLKGDHPVPRENTLRSSRELLNYLEREVKENDIVFVLISGGGSALFEVPAPGVTLDDIAFVTRELLRRGADIVELNAVRKHLSSVKGGQLLRYIRARRVFSLIISDVVEDRLDTIASGPTAPDETTYRDAYEVLVRRGLWSEVPPGVRKRIEDGLKGLAPETVKPGDPILNKVRNIIVASNTVSLEAMSRKARELGYEPIILSPYVVGEAREVGKVLAAVIKSVRRLGYPAKPPLAILAGGETTVTVRGDGVGGRNQELCLSIAIEISGLDNVVAGCMGSDGIDGVSPAAGAIVDGGLASEAMARGLNPREYLDRNDSYTFFSKLGRAIITGYTGTNVNDLFTALVR
ncbi:MAG: glycerate kinase [Crenarchaeota archaeon]|nr:glycerate kinase [Thermoproteota archaeon]